MHVAQQADTKPGPLRASDLREAVDVKMLEIEDYVRTVVETLEKEVKDCLLRRDKQSEEKLEQGSPAILGVTPAPITSPEGLHCAPVTPALNLSTAQPNSTSSGNDNGNQNLTPEPSIPVYHFPKRNFWRPRLMTPPFFN
ncbi:hypothetical protein DPX16_16610 [Anabarilius grahami]|uniref:Uncharacterized protein n=1 Tax=Anabarilius grahami TaxID=495550 RepID=A0A3N0YS29_ANAGA|nr:hypothetical protein DPX16_16610 [Anabarilius grahami]